MNDAADEHGKSYPPVTVARDIPLPRSISPEAQQKLAAMIGAPIPRGAAPEGIEAWETMIRFADEMLLAALPEPAADTRYEKVTLGGVSAYDVNPGNRSSVHVCLYMHGGALTMGAGEVAGRMTSGFAQGAQIRTFGVDYRMPPRHPYPVPLDDCVAAYQALIETHDPRNVVITGVSAGGTLAAAMVLRARDEGLPSPAAVVLLTPEVDLTESGDSFETLMGIDPVLRSRLTDTINVYAGGHNLADPYLSPLFGDFSKGYPRTFLQCGTRDLFLSNTVRFHRALRQVAIPAELHVFEAMPHGGFGSMLEGGLGETPEDRAVYDEVRRFLADLT